MALIKIQRDPARITNTEDSFFNGNLLDWLCDNETENFGDLHCLITLNSVVIADSSKMTGAELNESCDIEIGEFDQVCIVLRPAGIELTGWVLYGVIAAVAVTAFLVAKALIPNVNQNTTDGNSSSNNQLNASANSYRPNQAIPDIAGQVVSYPDFAQLSYYTYNAAGRRVFREIFVVGVGYYDFSWIKSEETLLDDIAGTTYTIYQPNETPLNLVNVRAVEAAENTDLINPASTEKLVNVISGSINDNVVVIGSSAISALQVSIGDNVELNLDCVEGGDGSSALVTGIYEVTDVTSTSITLDWANVTAYSIIGGYLINKSFTFEPPWYVLAGDEVTEVKFHLKMPTGIRSGDGDNATVIVTLVVERLDSMGDPTGVIYTRAASFTGNTQQAQAATFEINSEFGLTTAGSFRAKATRVTGSLGDNALDLIQLERLESVTPYTADFGFVTSLEVNRVTQNTTTSRSSTKINALVTRKLRIFDPETGIYGADYVATRRFCDYAFYVLYELMGVPLEYIDTDKLYSIHDNLTDAQLGYFDYTFDDSNVAARDRLQACCNAARVTPWEDVMIWTFVRDQARPVRSFMFNRRNLAGGNFQYLQNFRRPADFDSVAVKYVDPDKNAGQVISRKFDEDGVITSGVGIRPFEIDLIGCRNLAQATNRVELEVRRLIYQNITITDTALNDALLIAKGERTDYIDMYDSDMFDGEIIGFSGSVYSTSERFTPADGVEYWVYITDDDGNSSNSVRAYPRSDGNIFGFEATGLAGAYLPSGIQQLGSRYVIASNNDLDATQFIFDGRSRPNEKGECEITLIEYNELMYEMD